ncbi:hypothetical protein GN244_ATG10554 [Phytophthora infestans]|uniref:Uncharacterized protein n=1 Tax=Phytophthora infestans TaxID=4787 RepID=A0A833WU32_PHYIN|nr:hypothetical protein GN244_ATG10554 [Phytophthora infestans]
MTDQSYNTSASGSSASATVSASSCSWKTAMSQDGECFLEPRTCTECLEKIPSTGDTCVLTESGICMSVGDYAKTLAIHDGVYYVAGNATYCDLSSPSAQDCVVIDSCESSSWLSYARQRLPLIALAVDGDTPEGCSFATDTVTTEAGARSESTSEDTSFMRSSRKDTLSSDDKCTWYQNTTLCRTPRTCFDCLNTIADNGEPCTITPDGYCATLSSSYNSSLDFRSPSRAGVANGYYYPSTNTSYCEPSDAACSNCGIAGSASNSVSYCVGRDGCICVSYRRSVQPQHRPPH